MWIKNLKPKLKFISLTITYSSFLCFATRRSLRSLCYLQKLKIPSKCAFNYLLSTFSIETIPHPTITIIWFSPFYLFNVQLRQVREQNLVLVFNFHFYRQYDGINTQKFPTFLSLLALFYKFVPIKLNFSICASSSSRRRLLVLIFVRFSTSIFLYTFYFIHFKIDTSRYMYGGKGEVGNFLRNVEDLKAFKV